MTNIFKKVGSGVLTSFTRNWTSFVIGFVTAILVSLVQFNVIDQDKADSINTKITEVSNTAIEIAQLIDDSADILNNIKADSNITTKDITDLKQLFKNKDYTTALAKINTLIDIEQVKETATQLKTIQSNLNKCVSLIKSVK
jgi:hypothetical protein